MQALLESHSIPHLPVEVSRQSIPRDIRENFVFLSPIGNGYHGTVYKTFVKRNQRLVAAKLIHKIDFSNVALSQIDHPYILRLIDIVTSEIDPEFSMEIYPLSSTKRIMKDGHATEVGSTLENVDVPFEVLLKLFRQLLEAIHFLHINNIIHKDIKMSNVLVFNEDCPDDIMVQLTDFGRSCTPLLGYLGKKRDFKYFVLALLICLENHFFENPGIRASTIIDKWPVDLVVNATSLKSYLPEDIIRYIAELYKGQNLNYLNLKSLLSLLECPEIINEI